MLPAVAGTPWQLSGHSLAVKNKLSVVFLPGVYCCESCLSFRKDHDGSLMGAVEQSWPDH